RSVADHVQRQLRRPVRKTSQETRFGCPDSHRGRGTVTLLASLKCNLRSFLFYLLALLAFSASSKATIQYSISLEHPEQHLFHVTMTIPDVKAEVTVQMAAWNALYQIRDFSAHVQQVEAFAGNGAGDSDRLIALTPQKIDKQTWRVQANGTVSLRYATYW